ncbi:hypothetical protein DH2020_022562 [Rehmannia glutinosa]|uniref:Late embryogenesis abundant protein LEA-2 subgroup domain-containing protein n=1 Tax=Rehmannia glutinosa TaxID=99300 RepID=A0ABR0WDQ9_REHGL
MGTPSDDQRQKIVMGYPSLDRYNHQAQQMYPQPPPVYPVPYRPQNYASTSSHPFPQGYHDPSPMFQPDGKYMPSTSQKPYSPQPYNDYYYQQHYKPLVPESNSNSSFGRVMLILMIVLVASMCMMSLVMWFLFGTYVPEFEVASIKVSNFTVTNTTLTGTWNVDVSVSNTNKELALCFDHVMSSIFYKESLLGISAVQPFHVPQMQRYDVNFSMPAENGQKDNKLQDWVLPTLSQDHSNGMVLFSLRLALKANFSTPKMVYRQQSLRVLCDNMQVMFSINGEGTLSPGLGNSCLIRVHDSLKVCVDHLFKFFCPNLNFLFLLA